ncbi:hypothetical protein [Lewinella sp. 4G2]|uniref:hypothetical protein n=1 Tax=Lewinella sp. 4G2 TaxID=1803372 RepID=UPI0007B4DEEC|nr:hypothetical protein [Lewinella sp. 4G2]OAV43689.1 hypothetical protein A3850_003880 [Lewinella sp. 4G2]
MHYTIRHNSGGFHGHQLKDHFGARAIAKLYGLEYRHTPYPYLEFFGIGEGETPLPFFQRKLGIGAKPVAGPYWDGFTDYDTFRATFDPILQPAEGSGFIRLEKACRLHPHQTIAWQREGLIDRDIFGEIVQETTARYAAKHGPLPTRQPGDPLRVAMHISRGGDYNREQYPEHFADPYNVRYMFPMEYFLTIYRQIQAAAGGRAVELNIYTEERNSEDIVEAFTGLEGVTLYLGCNRRQPDEAEIEGIFKAFVAADVLVSCNSSFSTEAIFFRGDRPSIYHPHRHLNDLPDWPYLATDASGEFDVDELRRHL